MAYVGVELSLGIREQGQIELFLLWAEVVSFDNDGPGRQTKVVCTLDLRPKESVRIHTERSAGAERTFVRRSIILSNKIFSFLNAYSPGPCIPFFWIGVRISLFQKHV